MIIVPKVCAWCNSVKYIELKDDNGMPILNKWMPLSHTICSSCKEKELKNIENFVDN